MKGKNGGKLDITLSILKFTKPTIVWYELRDLLSAKKKVFKQLGSQSEKYTTAPLKRRSPRKGHGETKKKRNTGRNLIEDRQVFKKRKALHFL